MGDDPRPTKPGGSDPVAPPARDGSTKGHEAPALQAIDGRTVLKAEGAISTGSPPTGTAGGDGRDGDRGAQQPRPQPVGGGGYVRLRVRVENGEMSIVDSHLVDSPLLMPTTLHAAHAYEVTVGTTLLHADSIPDLGIVRSFANPDGPPEQRRHHSYALSTYEFDARVPTDALTAEALPDVTVALYRMKDRSPVRVQTLSRLGAQFERELREVARLRGIDPQFLP